MSKLRHQSSPNNGVSSVSATMADSSFLFQNACTSTLVSPNIFTATPEYATNVPADFSLGHPICDQTFLVITERAALGSYSITNVTPFNVTVSFAVLPLMA